jgi:hypothetical protein
MHQPIQIKTTTRNSTSHLVLRGLPRKEKLSHTHPMWIIRGLLLIPLVFICLGLLPAVRAVTPQPDGTYASFNVAEGFNALLSLSTGTSNTAIGFAALASNTTGSHNTAFGLNTMLFNTTGSFNMGIGGGCLRHNVTGNNNTAIGFQAMSANKAGDNSAVGYQALFKNTDGNSNNAFGFQALFANTTGIFNNAHGTLALDSNTTGVGNNGFGDSALGNNVTGNNNTAIGDAAGLNVTGSGNTFIGHRAGINETNVSNVLCIQSPGDATAFTASDRTFIGNIHGVTPGSGGIQTVIIDDDGQLGSMVSSRRFKKDIKPLDHKISEAILALKPVTFHYKNKDRDDATPEFGLVAEDVAEVNPNLIVRDKDGQPLSVRYEAVNTMLLNEFLKEHHRVEKLEATVASLMAMVTEQAAQIQKVSARLEAGKPALQVAANQ